MLQNSGNNLLEKEEKDEKGQTGDMARRAWLGGIAYIAINGGMTELATACVVDIAALLPKLVESEEKENKQE